MKRGLTHKFFAFLQVIALVAPATPAWAQESQAAKAPSWESNPGPDPTTEMGREFLKIRDSLPTYKPMSEALYDRVKFRYKYGPMMNRMFSYTENSVKIAFWGQDATHVAEFAKHTATAGFGGRAQDFANYFGVDKGAAFSNAFFSTIYGQYGNFSHPVVELDRSGKPNLRYTSYVDPLLWKLANDPKSPNFQSSKAYFEWMVKYNPESLDLIVLFGGASRDMLGAILKDLGAEVGTRLEESRLEFTRVPQTRLVNGGGNNEFAVLLDKEGRDLYDYLFNSEEKLKQYYKTEVAKEIANLEKQLARARGDKQKEIGYAIKDLKASLNKANKTGRIELVYSVEAIQKIAQNGVAIMGEKALDMMVFVEGGIKGSGVVDAAQLGGYDLNKVKINGQLTRNLKGLKLSDGTVITRDIMFVEMPHPSSLSRSTPADAAKRVADSLRVLEPYRKAGWKVTADAGMVNKWNAGEAYKYGRADIRSGYYEFGTPGIRMVSVSSASRMPRNDNVIISGMRGSVRFDDSQIRRAYEAQPSEKQNPKQVFTNPPQGGEFDRGAGDEIHRKLKEALPLEDLFKPKAGMNIKTNGIDALNVKNDPMRNEAGEIRGDFGHYRGDWKNSRVLILADPQGADDLLTSRALTGERGQYLNRLMFDMGIAEKYLVFKTVPFIMDGATADEWETVRKQTEKYREVAIEEALKSGKVELLIADGPVAQKELERIADKLGLELPLVKIDRDPSDLSKGLKEAAAEIRKIEGFKGKKHTVAMKDIPRSHLPWTQRVWDGTGGDRVLQAVDKNRGFAFASEIPAWAAEQEQTLKGQERAQVEAILAEEREAKIRLPGERMPQLLGRVGVMGSEAIPKLVESFKVKSSNVVINMNIESNVRRTEAPPKVSGAVTVKMCRDLYKKAN